MSALAFILGMVTGILMLLGAISWARHVEEGSRTALDGKERGE